MPKNPINAMNEFKAYCPQCKGEVVFVTIGKHATCAKCGFSYELAEPLTAQSSGAPTALKALLKVFVIVALIMAAIVVVGVAVIFAGCAALMKGF